MTAARKASAKKTPAPVRAAKKKKAASRTSQTLASRASAAPKRGPSRGKADKTIAALAKIARTAARPSPRGRKAGQASTAKERASYERELDRAASAIVDSVRGGAALRGGARATGPAGKAGKYKAAKPVNLELPFGSAERGRNSRKPEAPNKLAKRDLAKPAKRDLAKGTEKASKPGSLTSRLQERGAALRPSRVVRDVTEAETQPRAPFMPTRALRAAEEASAKSAESNKFSPTARSSTPRTQTRRPRAPKQPAITLIEPAPPPPRRGGVPGVAGVVRRMGKTAASLATLARKAITNIGATPSQSQSQDESNGGVNDGLAFRLPAAIKPTSYALHIKVNPETSNDYEGTVDIDLELAEPSSRVELHAADLRVTEATLTTDAGSSWSAQLELRPDRETVALIGESPVPIGRARLRVRFSSTLRSDLRGLYAASAGERKYAFTQLEAADARRFFPCFDEPAFKARFSVSVTTAPRLTVLSNSPIDHVDRDEDEKTVYFRPTPLLSTYLIALAVGELVQSEPVYAGGVPIRIVHVPGNEHLTAFALDAASESLTRLADYFGIPYPYEKLDLVAVPDFEIGAMENAGAVFFREALLLVDEQSVSLPEKKRAAEVICHELAHMWYGNLVTMRWWDDLWLNEAFATWMAFDVVAKWKPEWQMWNDFGHSRNSALQLDALQNTHAIYCTVLTPAEAAQNFDLITYEKGASVVRMLERYLGASTFQSGVRTYIARHREGNTVAGDLWRALEEAAGESIDKVVRPFIEQPGFPLVRVQRSQRDGEHELLLEQERFHASGPNASAHGGEWAVPWVGRIENGDSPIVRQLLDGPFARVPLGSTAPGFVYGNADEGGFFRPLHHPDDLPELIAALPSLSVSERLGFVNHQWALVRAGYAELDAFLELLPALAHARTNEADPDVLRALFAACDALVDGVADVAGPDVRSALQAVLARLYGPALDEIGWDTQPSDSNTVRLRRVELVTLCAVIAESKPAVAEAEKRAVAYLEDRGAVDANLVASLLMVAARGADTERLERFVEASEQDPTPQERRRFRMALSEVHDPALVQDVLQLCLGPKIPTQDVAIVLARLIGNRSAREATFGFVCSHWDAVRARMPAMLVSRLVDALPALQTDAYRAKVQAFFASHPVPTAERALRQADERFQLNANFSQRAAPVLRRWVLSQQR